MISSDFKTINRTATFNFGGPFFQAFLMKSVTTFWKYTNVFILKCHFIKAYYALILFT